MAHMSPAAPPPRTMTSQSCLTSSPASFPLARMSIPQRRLVTSGWRVVIALAEGIGNLAEDRTPPRRSLPIADERTANWPHEEQLSQFAFPKLLQGYISGRR